MVTIKHFGSISNGQLYLDDVNTYNQNLLALDGKEIELVIKEKFEETTPEEHGYYRGGIIPTILLHEAFGGWDKDELHAYLADRFLGETVEKEINNILVSHRVVPSTANIGKKRMAKYISDVIGWATIFGIEIKEPEYYVMNKYYTKNGKKEK